MVVTFGELLMRLTPPECKRIRQAQSLSIDFGGAEANTAVSLSQFGRKTSHVSVLPNNEIGLLCRSELMRYGVGVEDILLDTSEAARMGLYFYEKGASQRSSQVIYDRANSSFATVKAERFNWETILEHASWFHFTGITPALGEELEKATLSALKVAKEKQIPVSCDLNYRAKLWSKEIAGKVMCDYMPYVNVLFANSGSVYDLFQIGTDDYGRQEDVSVVGEIAKQVHEQFGIDAVAMTMRKTLSASQNLWSGLVYQQGSVTLSKQYTLDIVDRIGGGDSFAAGYLYSVLNGEHRQACLDFATAASCLKHSIQGDFNILSVDEVMALVNGNGTGNIKR